MKQIKPLLFFLIDVFINFYRLKQDRLQNWFIFTISGKKLRDMMSLKENKCQCVRNPSKTFKPMNNFTIDIDF